VKRVAQGALGVLVLLAVLVLGRTLGHTPRPRHVRGAPALEIDQRRVCERLGAALRIPSVSVAEPDAVQEARLQASFDFLLDRFGPLVGLCTVERFPRSLVLRWPGRQEDLAPLVLLAHLDVVGVEPGSEGEWTFPPFSGAVAAGFIWGRGALDDKASALAMLEAAELRISRGERPRRGVIFCFGLDEELGGERGARVQAERFAREGLEPFLVLDEGFAVLEGIVEGVPVPVAGVGIAEKGQLLLRLVVEADGGHASMPADRTALGILAAALARLEQSPAPAHIDGATALFFDELSRSMAFGPRLLFANRWLSEPFLVSALLERPSTAALLRSTCALTRARAGEAPNALPRSAVATLDLRIHPRESVAAARERVRRVIDDERVGIETLGRPTEPSALSPTHGPPWELLERTIGECYGEVIVAPALVVGATDARHFAPLTPHILRFNGLRLGPEDLERIHGVNERISSHHYLELIRFYWRLLGNA